MDWPGMSAFAIALTLLSTFSHAGWNLLARSRRNEHTFLLRCLWTVALVGFLPALACEFLLPGLPARAQWGSLCSGCVCGLYFFALARAYDSGDFTVVYPTARALPTLFIAFGDVARGRLPTLMGGGGIVLVTLGCLMIPLVSFRRISVRSYLNRTTFWAGLVAAAIVVFTLIDKYSCEAFSLSRQGPLSAARYCYRWFFFACLIYSLLIRLFGRPPDANAGPDWRRVGAASAMTFFSYGLVLWVFQISERAGYVMAFRQFSIVIGVVVALRWFGEKGAAVRVSAAVVICVGMALIAFYG